MPHLPDPTGPYAVGATTFVRRVSPPTPIGKAHLRPPGKQRQFSYDDLEPALLHEETAFTAYYPAALSSKPGSWFGTGHSHHKGVDWLIRPVADTIRGYEHFGGDNNSYPGWVGSLLRPVISMFGASVKIPAYVNAPLLAPAADAPKWPVVLFSHGLGGSRTTYSALCTHLASHGRVVLALEHRDGSGPAVFPRRTTSTGETTKTMLYLNPDNDVAWPDEKPQESWAHGQHNSERALRLRRDQLELRRRELHEAFSGIIALSEGTEGALAPMDGHAHDMGSWSGTLATDTVDLVGHSFGGATLFTLLSEPPPHRTGAREHDGGDRYPSLPIRQALALDPWLEPLPEPGPPPSPSAERPAEGGNTAPTRELLVINSESFTLWASHFASVRRAAAAFGAAHARVLTLVRGKHVHFSDFPLLTPRRFDPHGAVVLARTQTLAHAFLRRELRMHGDGLGVEGVPVQSEFKVEKTDESKGKQMAGEPGDVVVHE